MIYFTADLHFFHKNAIKHTNRPFSNVEEMNKKLIDNWNKTISFDDSVYILGDITLKGTQTITDIIMQLKGKKYLICGNHDHFAKQESFNKDLFVYIKDYDELQYKNIFFILSHYPFLSWHGKSRGSISLHGHDHNFAEYNLENREQKIKRYDVGADANNFTPISAESIIAFFEE